MVIIIIIQSSIYVLSHQYDIQSQGKHEQKEDRKTHSHKQKAKQDKLRVYNLNSNNNYSISAITQAIIGRYYYYGSTPLSWALVAFLVS
jgi:hypothetical protein